MSNFRKLYDEKIVPELMKEHNYTTIMAVPKLEKIVINMGVWEGSKDEKSISGQKCVVTKARKSIAGFKLREGQPVGVKVTLRGENMYNFFEKLVKIGLPRVRDFRGVSGHAFDGKGNYTIGINIPRNWIWWSDKGAWNGYYIRYYCKEQWRS